MTDRDEDAATAETQLPDDVRATEETLVPPMPVPAAPGPRTLVSHAAATTIPPDADLFGGPTRRGYAGATEPLARGAEEATLAAEVVAAAAAATVQARVLGGADRRTTGAMDETLVPAVPVVPAVPAAPVADPGATTARTVGEGLRAASIERFGAVERDRFELLGELARGGLGRVFRARDPRTGREVALKEVLRPSPDIIVRFAREALVTANLQHPAIVPVYEVGRWKTGEPFYAMKLVRGRALDAVIADATTAAARVALVTHVIAVAEALAYAHGERVIHRDLKPANVLVGPYGETVVIDWGVARNLASDDEPPPEPRRAASLAPGETAYGAVIGTPAYMAPEQAQGRPLDERADVYAIGALLYHVLAGARPYAEARTVDAILAAVDEGPPRPLAALAPDVPPELIAIAEKAMARAPEARYPTAEGLAADLRRFQAGQLVGAHRYSTGELVRRWIARHRGALGTAVVAVAALIGFGVVSVRRIAAERDEAERARVAAQRERADAQDARALAERRYGDSLEELGRQAAIAGAPERALPLLAAAAEGQALPSATRALMLGQARAAYAGLVAVAPAHPSGTMSAELARGGALVVTTGRDGVVRAWDVAARRVAWEGTGPERIAVSPDGERVLGMAADGTVTLRAAADGAVQQTWRLPNPNPNPDPNPNPNPDPNPNPNPIDPPSMLAWSPGGDRFAIGTLSGRVAVGAPGAAALSTGEPHDGEPWTLAFSPDGRALATVAADGLLAVRDPVTGGRRTSLGAPGVTTVGASWIDDGRIASVDSDRKARVWRVADRAVERELAHDHDPYGVLADPAGAWLVTYGDSTSATLWDLATGERRAELPGHAFAANQVAVAGPWLVTADEAGGVYAWDSRTGDRVQALPGEGPLYGVRARGDRVVLFGEGRTRVWQPAADVPLRRVPGHTARVRGLVFDAGGATVWSASNDGSARGFEPATGRARTLGRAAHTERPERELPDPSRNQPPYAHGVRSLTLSPDGATAAVALENGTITVWDAATGALRATWTGHTGRVRRVVFTADGRTAFSVGDTTVRRWEVATGRETGRAELGAAGWDLALLAGDGVVATVTDAASTLALWSAATLAPIAPVEFPVARTRDLVIVDDRVVAASPDQLTLVDAQGRALPPVAHHGAFSVDVSAPRDGKRLLAAGDSRQQVVLHDAATLAPVRAWHAGSTIAMVKFRPDGAVLAVAGGRRVRLWDPATGRQLAETPDLPAQITQLAWSPDGRTLALGGAIGTIWLWDLGAPAAATARFARCASPWQLGDGALVAAPFDPSTCDALPGAQP